MGWDYIIARYFVLNPLRFFFDHICWYYAYFYMNNKFMSYVACDCQPCHLNIVVDRNYKYGNRDDEILDIISPTGPNVEHKGPLIYAHGGGWVCVNRELLMQSITPFIRAGYTVYIIDYPLAPENKFPMPLISTLRAISWVKRHTGHESVTLLGDSAGGNLMTMAAALIYNKTLLNQFNQTLVDYDVNYYHKNNINVWDYPLINHVVSIYGVLDQTHHLNKTRNEELMKHMNFIERFFFKAQISILNFCFYSYRHPNDKEFFDGILTLGDLLQREDENGDNVIRNYPPLFLACSRQDPLISHTVYIHDIMNNNINNNQFQCEMFICDGIHSFHGLPIHLTFGYWKSQSFLATKHILNYITNGRIQLELDENIVVNFDFGLFFYLFFLLFGIFWLSSFIIYILNSFQYIVKICMVILFFSIICSRYILKRRREGEGKIE